MNNYPNSIIDFVNITNDNTIDDNKANIENGFITELSHMMSK
jgi:hypothetical protein